MLTWSNATLASPVAGLIRAHKAIHSDADAAILQRAYDVAERMHEGQFRKSGDAYITHPLAVARIVADLGMDTTTLVAALLHDTVEDTSYTMRELRADFGQEVALVVDGVTKFDKVFYGDVAESETIRKMIVSAGQDVRVLVVKLADRLHNMRTLDARSDNSRRRIARATQDVLVPLCDRLGIQVLKRDLEDTVLKALEPETHARLSAYVLHRPEWMAYLQAFVSLAQDSLRSSKIPGRVLGRPRHLFSVWKDTVAGGYDEPHDPPRIVVIVSGPETDCYTALGALHGQWRPVPGRFKDFIASPKNNLYRSLHTTVIGPDNEHVEVMIRTETMHRNAEFGIAAAYRFPTRERGTGLARLTRPVGARGAGSRSGGPRQTGVRDAARHDGVAAGAPRANPDHTDLVAAGAGEPALLAGAAADGPGPDGGRAPAGRTPGPHGHARAEHLTWLHRVVQWQRETIDPVQFLESLRCDLAEAQIHVFSAGKRLLLPAGATPVDVAYALAEVNPAHLVSATVNGRLAPLSSALGDGDTVDVHTADVVDPTGPDGSPLGPSREWLSFVRTSEARLRIMRWLEENDEAHHEPPMSIAAKVRVGQAALALAMHARERGLAEPTPLVRVAAELGFPDPDALFAAVAEQRHTADEVIDRMIEWTERRAKEQTS
jgi:GTP pyrophosphokinase